MRLAPVSAHIQALRKALFATLAIFLFALLLVGPLVPSALQYLLREMAEEGWKKELVLEERWTNTLSSPKTLNGKTLGPGESILVTTKTPKALALSPLEVLSVEIRLALWLSLGFSLPFLLWPLLSFFWPALLHMEKRVLALFLVQSIFTGAGSLWLAWKTTLPWTLSMMRKGAEAYALPLYSLREMVDFVETILIFHLVVFQLFAFFLLLLGCQIIDEKILRSRRKEAVISIFIISAIVTPPDVFSQMALALPLWGLYELLLFVGWFFRKKGEETSYIN